MDLVVVVVVFNMYKRVELEQRRAVEEGGGVQWLHKSGLGEIKSP